MKVEEFKQETIQKTLKYIGESPENWITFNDKLHTYIIDNEYQMKFKIDLYSDELPILECILEDSSVLITTKRVISNIFDNLHEISLIEIEGFGNEYEKENYEKVDGKYPKTNLIVINGVNDQKLIFKMDSYYPVSFAKLLISNLSGYLQDGQWRWNPTRSF